MKRYWDHYFNPLKVDGVFEVLFRSVLLVFFIMGTIMGTIIVTLTFIGMKFSDFQ